MNKDFRMQPENAPAAMERIIETLTEPQCAALAVALHQAGPTADVVKLTANERTIESLLRGTAPLIEQRRNKRFLSPLGMDVARYLLGTGKFATMPDMSELLPPLPDGKGLLPPGRGKR